MTDQIDRIYGHRHKVPCWDQEDSADVAAELGYRTADALVAHVRYQEQPTSAHCDGLKAALLNLGVTTWWALRSLNPGEFDRDHVALSAAATNLDSSEDWAAAAEPMTAFASVIGNRLSAAIATLGTKDLPTSTDKKVSRQLLFATAQIEQALAFLDR